MATRGLPGKESRGPKRWKLKGRGRIELPTSGLQCMHVLKDKPTMLLGKRLCTDSA